MRWPPASGSQQDATTASTSSPTAGCTVANDPVAQTSLEPWTVIRTPGATDRRLREYLASGMGELHLYHLGLLDAQGLATMRHVVATTRRLAAQQGSA